MAASKKSIKSKKKGTPGKTKIEKKTRYFTYSDVTNRIDLKEKKLQIKQLVPFGSVEKDEIPVTLSLWELQPEGSTDRGKSYEILQIKGKVSKANKYKLEVLSLEQDSKKFPKPKNEKNTELWMPAKLEIVDPDGKVVAGAADLEFVLPPMEYDETLEIQLGCTIGEAVCGVAKVTWDSLDSIQNGLGVVDRTAGISTGGKQYGRPTMVVVHCMCAVKVVGEKREESFKIDKNIQIFKDYGLSAHFIIDREGTIFQTAKTNKKAWHASPHNTRSIGIELLGFADDFRIAEEKKYEKLLSGKKKQTDYRTAIEQKLSEHKKSKEKTVKTVKVGKKYMPVDKAISNCEAAISMLDSKIEKIQKRIDAYEEWVEDKNADNIPIVYTYTDKQYKSLGALLEVFSKRYRCQNISSHHRLDKDRKKDPGKYFNWSEILPYLLPGKLDGDESGDGGQYSIS